MLPAGSWLGAHGTEDLPRRIDNPFGNANHGVLLNVEDGVHPLDQRAGLDRGLGDENDIGLAVGRAQRDHAAVAAHHLDDGDPAMAFGRGPDPLDAERGDEHGGREARRDEVHHVVEAERALGAFLGDVPLGMVTRRVPDTSRWLRRGS